MDALQLRNRQAPLKELYRLEPESARARLKASGTLNPSTLTCRISKTGGAIEAGLHPMAGGEDQWACSGEMLLESLVACAGVTMLAVASALQVEIRGGTVMAEGDLDFRGTLGVNKEVPVGFRSIHLSFELETTASREQLEKLLQLTERYCVVFQTLRSPAELTVSMATGVDAPKR
jgi:uncharacterized OsmC-like protein